MTTLEDLERRVTVLEADRRDFTLVLARLDDLNDKVDRNFQRQVAFELETKAAFAELRSDVSKIDRRLDALQNDVSSLRRELPAMLAEALREALDRKE